MIVIYKITSPSGKINIGQSRHWDNRLNNYKNGWCKSQTKLYNSLKKYGFENHKVEIILTLPENITQDTLNFYEIYWWKYYKDLDYDMMNIKEPGSNGRPSEETLQKLRGKKRSSETLERMRNSQLGHKQSKESILKMIATKKLNNKPRTEEHRRHLSEAADCYGLTWYGLGYKLR